MASLILGIMGKKRSGKDTFAARLVAEHGFTRLSLADPLREMAKALDPIVDWVGDDVRIDPVSLTEVLGPDDDWEVAKELPEVRRLLQHLGTDAVRGVLGNNTWVDHLADRAAAVPGPVVVPDVRFPDEADFIKAVGGELVRVVRPGLIVAGGGQAEQHISETALDDRVPDYYVRNDADIDELHTRADGVARVALSR